MNERKLAWAGVTDAQVQSLRVVLGTLEQKLKIAAVSENASVHEYDLRNFLSGNSGRPRARVGLRLLAFAARQNRDEIPTTVVEEYDRVVDVASAIFKFEADDDHFFKYLEQIRATSVAECKSVAKGAGGNYFAYRLGNTVDSVLRSHVSVKPYSPFERLPRFSNIAKFASIDHGVGPIRRADGQILAINNAYAFVSFIFDTQDEPIGSYKGLNICIIPAADLHAKEKPAKGLFVSFTHGGRDRYEYGPLALVRTKEHYKPHLIGEFSIDRLAIMEPSINPEDLKYDVAGIVDHRGLLTACMSMAVFGAGS